MKSLSYSQMLQDHLLRGMPSPISGDSLSVALHSEDPANDGMQLSYELPGVSRGSIGRNQSAWEQHGARYRSAVPIRFGKAEPHNQKRIARFWSLADAFGTVMITGEIKPPQEIVEGAYLEFPPGSLVSEEL